MFFLKPKPSVPVQPAMGCSVGHVSFEDAYEAMFFLQRGRWLSQNTSNPNGAKKILEEIPEQVMIMIWFGNFS